MPTHAMKDGRKHTKAVPDSVVGEVGTSKRNIIRKGGLSKERKAGSRQLDDGSLYNDPNSLNENDPNYDSEDDGGEYPVFGSLHREAIGNSRLTLTQYKKQIGPHILEYFVSGDCDEVARNIMEIEAPEYTYEFVKRLINMSLDQTDKERELVSQLLTAVHPDVISSSMIGKGFERLFELVDEIEKDCPLARQHLATYLARAVLDEVIPPSFLGDSVVCNLGGEIVEQAKMMLSRDHSGARLEKSWGPGDGRPAFEMKKAVDQCMQEFLISGDKVEATRCISELNAPFFAHEVLKRGVVNSLDKGEERHLLMSSLLAHLYAQELVSPYQAFKGFETLKRVTPDVSLDVPNAADIIEGFRLRAVTDGLLSPTVTA